MGGVSIETSHFIPYPRTIVWDWHSMPGAVVRLTPRNVPMQPVQQADNLASGLTRFSLPAGLVWDAQHELAGYRKGHQFVDVCTSAPIKLFSQWRHVHTFKDEGPSGTMITDSVSTRVPARALKSLFAFRQHALLGDLNALARINATAPESMYADPSTDSEALPSVLSLGLPDNRRLRPLTVAVTGSRGLVGRALTAQLTTAGHKVIQLVRGDAKPGQRHWTPQRADPDLLDDVDVLVHLAGEPLLGRFNDEHKKAIYDSRVYPTSKLAEVVASSPRCATMVCASSIGFYGADRGEEKLSEDSSAGEGFLATMVQDWEDACEPAREAGKRVVNIRTGVVLAANGGVLAILKMLFSAGLGGPFGERNPWFSWISLDDLTDIYLRAAIDPALEGPVNATAPNPVPNTKMVSALGAELNRPTIIPIPSIGPKLLLGTEGAEELALANQRVLPSRLLELGHEFRHSAIETCLAHELGGQELLNNDQGSNDAD